MEGKFANHGLQALDDDDDMLTAMARELVTQKGVGEKADACWREVQREHTRLLEVQRISVTERPEEPVSTAIPTEEPSAAPEPPGPTDALVELAMPQTRVARKRPSILTAMHNSRCLFEPTKPQQIKRAERPCLQSLREARLISEGVREWRTKAHSSRNCRSRAK